MADALARLGYRVLAPIGRGGMAEILLVERRGAAGIHKRMVIKRVLPELARDPEFARRFLNEARIAVTLQHPNIVSVFECGAAESELYLAMEYVDGWTLAAILQRCVSRDEKPPIPFALQVGAELCMALTYAHEKVGPSGQPLRIIHRDVSPGNLLVSREGDVKLTDFGIARAALHAKTSMAGQLSGKPGYMSPEQAAGAEVDARSDLFSAGIVVYEALTSLRALSGRTIEEIIARARVADVRPVEQVRGDVPEAVRAFLARALDARPNARFQTAREMHAALNAILRAHAPEYTRIDVGAYLSSLDLEPPDAFARTEEGTPRAPRGGSPADVGTDHAESTLVAAPSLPFSNDAPVPARPKKSSSAAARVWPHAVAFAAAASIVFIIGRALGPSRTSATQTRLEVRSEPPGADVFVDDRALGITPVVLANVPRRPVIVKVVSSATGHEHRRTIDLAARPDAVVDVSLR